MNKISRKEQLKGFCTCAGCKPATARARANVAIRMMKQQRELGRPFDHCFETEDSDDVVRHITQQARADEELERLIRRRGCGYWLDPVQYGWLWGGAESHPFADSMNNRRLHHAGGTFGSVALDSDAPDFTLESWGGDPGTVRIVCACGEKGRLMSRYRNTDDSGTWEPKLEHLPECEHFKQAREA